MKKTLLFLLALSLSTLAQAVQPKTGRWIVVGYNGSTIIGAHNLQVSASGSASGRGVFNNASYSKLSGSFNDEGEFKLVQRINGLKRIYKGKLTSSTKFTATLPSGEYVVASFVRDKQAGAYEGLFSDLNFSSTQFCYFVITPTGQAAGFFLYPDRQVYPIFGQTNNNRFTLSSTMYDLSASGVVQSGNKLKGEYFSNSIAGVFLGGLIK